MRCSRSHLVEPKRSRLIAGDRSTRKKNAAVNGIKEVGAPAERDWICQRQKLTPQDKDFTLVFEQMLDHRSILNCCAPCAKVKSRDVAWRWLTLDRAVRNAKVAANGLVADNERRAIIGEQMRRNDDGRNSRRAADWQVHAWRRFWRAFGSVWLRQASSRRFRRHRHRPEVRRGSSRSKPARARALALENVKSGETYGLLVTLLGGRLADDDRVEVELVGAGADRITKELHAGDPDLYLPYRPRADGQARLSLARTGKNGDARLEVRVAWTHLSIPEADRAAIEAEPNDSWREANELRLGRDVYGTGDDVDYLENRAEGKTGLDWFRFEVKDDKPILVYFQLDLLDRDVSANLRVYTVDAKTGRPEPYLKGKDPMEIVHDRERERYSKHISRSFTRGTYYLEVNANHPDYILRTRVLPVPPYDEPSQAVEAGMHYIMNVGDAWFAQVPREGNIYVRSGQHARHGHAVHGLSSFELFDRGQPDRSSQRL